MAAQEAALNHAADGIRNKVGEIALYDDSANPDASSGTTGELTGGTYDRVAPTYTAAAGGTSDTGDLVFNGPGTSTVVAYIGFWSNDGTPVYLGSAALSASKTLDSGDTLTITSAPITVS